MEPASFREPDEQSLRAANDRQMKIIADADVEALGAFLHPNFIINGPTNRVGRRDQVLGMLAAGAISHESYERTIEGTAITGNVGVVTGNELVEPSKASALGQSHGTEQLRRRFTDVYLFEGGDWKFLARQATITSA